MVIDENWIPFVGFYKRKSGYKGLIGLKDLFDTRI